MDLQRLVSLLRQGIQRFDMIQPGEKIAVGLSGGKDSMALLTGLEKLRTFSPVPFDLCAIHVSSGAPGAEKGIEVMRSYCERLNVPFYPVETEIYRIVFEARREKNPCSLCAKMRKGALNDRALSLHCTAIAYAHHKDDFIETSVMNLFLEGHYGCFPPVTHLDRAVLKVIRPMLLVDERDIVGFARKSGLPVVKNPCPADGRTKRQEVKAFIRDSRSLFPDARASLFSALLTEFDRKA